MAKARAKPRTKALPPPPPPEPDAPVVEEESERASRGTILATAGVVVASLAATILLLSGWTPGPGAPAPRRAAAGAPAAAKNTASKNIAPKRAAPKTKRVEAKARKRVASGPPSTRLVSKRLFQEDCGFCHTLATAGTKGRVGPNLDKLRPGRQRVLDAIAAGGRRTGLMPPDILTGSDALNLATFVAEATRR